MELPQAVDNLASTILYLRPRTSLATSALDFEDNKRYVQPLVLPPEPTVNHVGETPNSTLAEQDYTSKSRESSPEIVCLQVLRLGFDSIQKQRTQGFVFGFNS